MHAVLYIAGVELADQTSFCCTALGLGVHVVDGTAGGAVGLGDYSTCAEQQALAFRLGATGCQIALQIGREVKLCTRQSAAVGVFAVGALEQVHITLRRSQ